MVKLTNKEFDDLCKTSAIHLMSSKELCNRMSAEQFDQACAEYPGFSLYTTHVRNAMTDVQFKRSCLKYPGLALINEFVSKRMDDELFNRCFDLCKENSIIVSRYSCDRLTDQQFKSVYSDTEHRLFPKYIKERLDKLNKEI